MKLPDLLAPKLKIVFCGTAASDISAREKAYYANPQNAFWKTLHQIGLTPHQYAPKDFPKLLALGIGLTDLAKYAQGMDKALNAADFDKASLREKILHYQPQYLAFTSKKAASVFLEKSSSNLGYRLQTDTLEKTKIWLLPSPSGAARAFWDISHWQALADAIL